MSCKTDMIGRVPRDGSCPSGLPGLGSCPSVTVLNHRGEVVAVIPAGGEYTLVSSKVLDEGSVLEDEMSPGESYQYACGPPIPQAGVCTPYPIAIPVQTDILSYVSAFNSCDLFKVNDGTGPITLDGDNCTYINDLTVNDNDISSITIINPSIIRGFSYHDNGLGDVYFTAQGYGGSLPAMSPNSAWRLNTDVKTVIFLARSPDVTNNTTTRLGFHYTGGMLRFTASKLELFSTGSMTNVLASNDTWHVISCRVDDNCRLGIDKTYETVSATAPAISNTDFMMGSPNGANGQWTGSIREIAIYSGSISDVDMDTMVDYMKDKWGL